MLLEIKNLYKSYDNKVVLNDINLKIKKGKIVRLLGQNGTGNNSWY